MPDQIPILLIAGRRSFSGTVEHGSHRILDVLNDASTDYLRLHDVTVHRDIQGEQIAQLSDATVMKSKIDAAILLAPKHEAPLRQRFAFVEKQAYSVLVAMANYEIQGNLHLKGRPDPRMVIGREAPTFVAVTEARISSGDVGDRIIQSGVALINKSSVALIHIGLVPFTSGEVS